MDQKSIQKSMGKSRERNIRFGRFLGGGHPRARHPVAGIVRPPNYQLPNTTGTGQWAWVRTGTRAWARVFGA